MKLMQVCCAITLTLLGSVVQANPLSGQSPTLSINEPLAQPGPSEVQYNKKIYDIWCNPKGDDCFLTTNSGGRKLTRERLRAHIPMADQTVNCSLEFCYNDDQDVIGLNPEYYLWKK